MFCKEGSARVNVLGDPEITENLYCNFVYLYWEGCVKCSKYLTRNFCPYRYLSLFYSSPFFYLSSFLSFTFFLPLSLLFLSVSTLPAPISLSFTQQIHATSLLCVYVERERVTLLVYLFPFLSLLYPGTISLLSISFTQQIHATSMFVCVE